MDWGVPGPRLLGVDRPVRPRLPAGGLAGHPWARDPAGGRPRAGHHRHGRLHRPDVARVGSLPRATRGRRRLPRLCLPGAGGCLQHRSRHQPPASHQPRRPGRTRECPGAGVRGRPARGGDPVRDGRCSTCGGRRTAGDPPGSWSHRCSRVFAAALVGWMFDPPPGSLLIITFEDSSGLPHITPFGAAVHLTTSALFFAGAYVSRDLWHAGRSVIDGWIAVGLVFAGFAELHWVLYPSAHPGQVSTADVLVLAFSACLLAGMASAFRANQRELRAANVELGELRDAEVERAATEERTRLARELHDGLAQDLWLAKMRTGELLAMDGLAARGPASSRGRRRGDRRRARRCPRGRGRPAQPGACRYRLLQPRSHCRRGPRRPVRPPGRVHVRGRSHAADRTADPGRDPPDHPGGSIQRRPPCRRHRGRRAPRDRRRPDHAAHRRQRARVRRRRRSGPRRYGLASMRERAALIGGRLGSPPRPRRARCHPDRAVLATDVARRGGDRVDRAGPPGSG